MDIFADLEDGNDWSSPAPRQSKSLVVEVCIRCAGSGKFRGFSGIPQGPCFSCKGTGKRSYKNDRQTREANRAKAQQRVQKKADAWREANPDRYGWLTAKAPTFGFASDLLGRVDKGQEPSDRQLETIDRLMKQDAERKAQWDAERKAREASAPAIDVSRIEEAFATAQSNGVKRPKLRLDTFTFSLAPAHGVNAGALYVKEGEEYCGKITGGKFIATRSCTASDRILAVASDPANAAVAYGKRFGSCSCCGRELTNHASIDLGIGPICAQKFGW